MKKKMTYKQSGVDIEKTNAMVKTIKNVCKKTNRSEVLGKIGSFSGFFSLPQKKYRNPVLVAATDGVGTKLMIAQYRNNFKSIGIDLVAMCVNDIITSGAEPLYFLDYYATGKVNEKHFFDILAGIAKGCKESNCSLIGGEIAEMPDFYTKEKFDLAGFCTGVVDRRKIITGSKVSSGDVVIGLNSSGLHSNGYSLARKLFTKTEISKGQWGKLLLKPTIIYTKAIRMLVEKNVCKSIAHITGGGLIDNIPRVLPKNMDVCIQKNSWKIPKIFNEIQKRGSITEKEMFRTFNMGIGMIVIISKKNVNNVVKILRKNKVEHAIIGTVKLGSNRVLIK